MKISKVIAVGAALAMCAGTVDAASARVVKKSRTHVAKSQHYRQYGSRDNGAGAAVAGAALGLIGAGVAGAVAANSYGYGGYPAYGYGAPAYGYGAPGYGYGGGYAQPGYGYSSY